MPPDSSSSRDLAVFPCLPFAVDTFTSETINKPQFLTHAHKDHFSGNSGVGGVDTYGRHIYCTHKTQRLLLIRFPRLLEKVKFTNIEVGEEINIPSDNDGIEFTVRALEAYHCPGENLDQQQETQQQFPVTFDKYILLMPKYPAVWLNYSHSSCGRGCCTGADSITVAAEEPAF